MPASSSQTIQIVAAIVFAVALLHTFAVKPIELLARRLPAAARVFHLLGEVEVVFGFWALVFVAAMALIEGPAQALAYARSRHYAEPLFVFVVMVVAASRPIIQGVLACVDGLARRLPLPGPLTLAWLGLAGVPLLGSLITEPAAMTIAALLLSAQVFRRELPERPKYFALGTLFVNVSIGGTLSSFAAPPVLMVASRWHWDSVYMLTHFGWKAALAVGINATLATWVLARHQRRAPPPLPADARADPVPLSMVAIHAAFLAGAVVLAQRPVALLGLFLLFVACTRLSRRHQSPLIVKQALLVAFFLAGLVLLGGMQQWWLQPLVLGLSPRALYFGATALTAVTDNAALTYLGSLIAQLPDEAKHALTAGAVTGGGLTVIANAPNPAGVALLRAGFADAAVGALGLLTGALLPTLVALLVMMPF